MPQTLEADAKIFELHAALCQTLANPVRLRILALLRDGERSVNELAHSLGVPQANVSQHLSVLRERNVVTTRREGVSIYYKIAYPKIVKACDLIREVLLDQLAQASEFAKQAARSAA